MDNISSHYKRYLEELNEALRSVKETDLTKLLELLALAEKHQHTVFIAGNGGNASTASHWATDLGKGLRHSTNLNIKALSLSDNISWISAAANDVSYDAIFSDQLETHGKKGDILICLSASGESSNILAAIKQAKNMGVTTFSIIGFDGGAVKRISDYSIHIPTQHGRYGVVEDAQLILNHFIYDYFMENGLRGLSK